MAIFRGFASKCPFSLRRVGKILCRRGYRKSGFTNEYAFGPQGKHSLGPAQAYPKNLLRQKIFLKFRRVTMRVAQPSARLSEEICLSEGSAGVSQRALRGSLRGFCGALRGSAGDPRDFPRLFGGSDPMLVILGNCSKYP